MESTTNILRRHRNRLGRVIFAMICPKATNIKLHPKTDLHETWRHDNAETQKVGSLKEVKDPSPEESFPIDWQELGKLKIRNGVPMTNFIELEILDERVQRLLILTVKILRVRSQAACVLC
jgi:hypothetical protein